MRRAATGARRRLAALGAPAEQSAGLATGPASTPLFGTSAGRLQNAGAKQGAALAGPAGQARGAAAALPAAAAAATTRLQPDVLPLTRVDEFGATSILESQEMATFVPQVFENVDGRRIEDGRYAAFAKDLAGAPLQASVLCAGGQQLQDRRAGQPHETRASLAARRRAGLPRRGAAAAAWPWCRWDAAVPPPRLRPACPHRRGGGRACGAPVHRQGAPRVLRSYGCL